MDENVAIVNIQQVKEVLDKHGIEFWLDIGTLLGAVRDGKFVSWDHDIDLSTWQENSVKINQALKEFRNKGLEIRFGRNGYTLQKEDVPLSISLYQRENGNAKIHWGNNNISHWLSKFINILFYAVLTPQYSNISFDMAYSNKDKIRFMLSRLGRIMPLFIKRWATKIEYKWGPKFVWIIPADYFSDFTTINFYEMEFEVPAKTGEYLTYRYGEDWQIPKKDWITERDDGAVFNARKYFQEVYLTQKEISK